MTQINSSSPSIFRGNQLKEDQNHPHLSSITSTTPQTSSSSSLSCHIILNKTTLLHGDDHGTVFYHKDIQQPHNQQQVDNFDLRGGSYNIENESESKSGLKFSMWKEQVMTTTDENQSAESNNTSTSIQVKWMSSKMRLMHKMKSNNSDPTATNNAPLMKLDQDPPSFISPMDQAADSNTTTSASNNTTIRVCSDCNTTKTPLWRSGPCGPKSLCNACGIRQRKARRAMAAAAAATANGTIILNERSPMKISKAKQKEKRLNGSKYKKRCKIATTTSHSRKELRFEEFLMGLSKKLALHRMFPQDEKEAAILLMALSCGHIHGY